MLQRNHGRKPRKRVATSERYQMFIQVMDPAGHPTRGGRMVPCRPLNSARVVTNPIQLRSGAFKGPSIERPILSGSRATDHQIGRATDHQIGRDP